jgi:hypothetical protein
MSEQENKSMNNNDKAIISELVFVTSMVVSGVLVVATTVSFARREIGLFGFVPVYLMVILTMLAVRHVLTKDKE